MSPSLVAAAVKLCIQRAVFFCPIQQRPGAFPAGSVPAELRIDTVFHDEALAILEREDHRHGESNILSVPLKKQEEAAVLWSAVNFHHVVIILGTKKAFQFACIRMGKNVPPVIGMKLFPESGNIVFRDCFTDGDPVFHLISSNTLFGGLGSVNPPYTTQFHKNHPFLIQFVFKCLFTA